MRAMSGAGRTLVVGNRGGTACSSSCVSVTVPVSNNNNRWFSRERPAAKAWTLLKNNNVVLSPPSSWRRSRPVRCGAAKRTTTTAKATTALDDETTASSPSTTTTTTTGGGGGGEAEAPSEAEALRRRRISEAMKRRWRNDEGYKAKVSKGRSGIEPWNKGKRLSEKHKQGISSSRRGRTHTRETREKMSRSHRRRHTAARVLQSVDKIVQAQEATRAQEAGPTPPPKPRGRGAGKDATNPDHQKRAMVSRYKGMLHDFRVLEGEIEPWVSQFSKEHGRKPSMKDVTATKMDWLIQKYRTYNLMKQQLMAQIPGIRGQVSGASTAKGAKLLGEAEMTKQAKLSAFFSAISNSKAASEGYAGGGDDAFGELESASPRVRKAMMDARKYREGKAAGQGGGGWDAAA